MHPRRYTLVCFICYGGGLFDDPPVFVPRAYRRLYSPSLCCFFFGATSMSARTAPLYGWDVIAELWVTLVRLSGAANLWDARMGHLLAQWSVSSPHCKARWEQATVEGGHKVVRAAEDAAIREDAKSLITPLGAVELVVALKAPEVQLPCPVGVLHPVGSTKLLEDRTAISAAHLYPGGLRLRVAGSLYPPPAGAPPPPCHRR